EKNVEVAATSLQEAGEALSVRRRKAAKSFDESVNAGLAKLMMKGARFRTDMARASDPTENGLDVVRMRIQTNPGEAEGPLEEIASTGELSRIALVLKPLAGGGGGTL